MKDFLIQCRNKIIHGLYSTILKPIFFKYDPEVAHDRAVVFGSRLGKHRITRVLTKVFFGYSNEGLNQNILGISFENPVGLAAGFDKNAELTDILPSVGFGFAEIGSVTGSPCAGNPKPRLWRLKESRGLVVYYGLKNDGCDAIVAKIKNKKFQNRIGTSVAMTNCKENLDIDTAITDYAKAFKAFSHIGDYVTINISCPNAEGGQPFIDPAQLDHLLHAIDTIDTNKPVFIKLSPDISFPNVDAILDIAKNHRIHGIICTNLTKKRNNPKIVDKNIPAVGGISGKPVSMLSDELLSYIYKKEKKHFILIGCGGIFSAEDAYKKIRLGASLVQLITGMIFEGPQLASEINRGLVHFLKRDGFTNISEAIGVDA